MKLLSFTINNHSTFGIAQDDNTVADVGSICHLTLQQFIASEQSLSSLQSLVAKAKSYHINSITLLPPINAPEKIICIGVNYANRNSEYKDGSVAPKYPSVFMRTIDSLTGHLNPLWRPPESLQLDYEGEIVAVIGRGGRRIKQQHSLDHIFGYTIMNEGTIRDWVRHAKFNVTQGKNFKNSGSLGPWIVTADKWTKSEVANMHITTYVNDEKRQDDTTANMMFPIDYIIHYCSLFFTLKPGDIIATGTPNGAGARFEPPKYLAPGDVVTVEVQGIGRLSNGVIDEPI